MINPSLGLTKIDKKIFENLQEKPSTKKEEQPGSKFTKRSSTKTFFNGAASFYFGAEPTMKAAIGLNSKLLKQSIERIESLYLEDDFVHKD